MNKRPWEYLPIPMPNQYDQGPEFFYEQIAKPLIADFIRMMCNGLLIDDNKVEELRTTLDTNLAKVTETLNANPIIQKFQEHQYKENYSKLEAEQRAKFRTIDYYLKQYDYKKVDRRTALVNHYLASINRSDLQKTKWIAKDIKLIANYLDDAFLSGDNIKTLSPDSDVAKKAMLKLAQTKLDIYNKSKLTDLANKPKEKILPPFNPGSSVQKFKLLSETLGYESGKESKAYIKYHKELSYGKTPVDKNGRPKKEPNQWSWGRDQLEDLLHMIPDTDTDLQELLQALVDYSFNSIIRTNFIEAFDTFTIDNYLHGNIRLLGAVSGRNTSNSPNMLNMPSTKSIFAKPVKQCFVAPEGYLVFQADFSALEEVCLANLSKDKNKLAIFQQGLDSHCFNSYGYYTEEIELVLPRHQDESDNDYIKRYKQEVDNNSTLKAIRQRSKPVSFKLNYLGMADADKGGVITDEIYDKFHNELYTGVALFLADMIANHKRNGYTHLGLGFRIYSSNIDKHFRTIWNAYAGQFWSILSLITVNEMHYRVDTNNLSEDIIFNSTIYDAVYCYVKKDAKTIKWLNDNLIEVMTKDWLEGQIIKNQVEGEIGHTWIAEAIIPNGASEDEIQEILNKMDS